jgi:hypothetical protein
MNAADPQSLRTLEHRAEHGLRSFSLCVLGLDRAEPSVITSRNGMAALKVEQCAEAVVSLTHSRGPM